jgi:uncharacterized protein (UPF0548 family)
MFCLSKPSRESIRVFISAQKDQSFSYTEVGASKERIQTGYTVDHNRIHLGKGDEVFERAKKAIRQWSMFNMPWVDLCWPDTPIESGATVAVLVSHFGLWSLNACRIVYVVDEHGALKRYGFSYGTLLEHGEIGEERFTVEQQAKDNSVWYDIYAFSRPKFVTRLGFPFARALQKRFARDSKLAMLKAVQSV